MGEGLIMVDVCMHPKEALLRADSMYSAGVGSRGGGGRGSRGGPCVSIIREDIVTRVLAIAKDN